jgi:hypothetical protein
MAYMAEIGQLFYAASGSTDVYFDLSSALTAVNRKQYHQFSKRGRPLCFDVTVEHIFPAAPAAALTWMTAPNNWTVRNACVKMSAAWKHQLKEAGIRMRDISKYGRRLRLSLDKGMSASTGFMQYVIEPKGILASDVGVEKRFQGYTAPDGTSIGYDNANMFTRVAIPAEAGTDSLEMNLSLMGYSEAVADNAFFGVVAEYLGSRGGVPDKPDSSDQTPDHDNLLQTLFSSTQPSTDEVIEAIEDYNEYRPYDDDQDDATASPPTQSKLCDTLELNGFTSAPYAVAGNSTAAEFAGYSSVIHLKCPLGLIRMGGVANKDQIRVTINAIYEM